MATTTTIALVVLASASFADGGGGFFDPPEQFGEDRWVPSASVTMGVTIQGQSGSVSSVLYEDLTPPAIALRGTDSGDTQAVSPFIGVDFQLMSPALRLPTRPRLFIGAEILPTFAVDRDLAFEGSPDCVRGPEPNVPCARDEDGSRRNGFGQDSANGEGSTTTATLHPLTYGLAAGISFPFEVIRPLRFKPVAAFMSYRVDATGLVVNAACDPVTTCTDYTPFPGFPSIPGFLRETIIEGSGSQRFYGVGPGFDVEMDAGRFGKMGAALYLGMRAYKVFGDRSIDFNAEQAYDDQIGEDLAAASFNVSVAPWIYRAHLGMRIQWLGDLD